MIFMAASKPIYKTIRFSADTYRSFEAKIVLIYDPVADKTFENKTSDDIFNDSNILSENASSIQVIALNIIPGKVYDEIKIPLFKDKTLINCLVFFKLHKTYGKNGEILRAPAVNKIVVGKATGAFVMVNDDAVSLMQYSDFLKKYSKNTK